VACRSACPGSCPRHACTNALSERRSLELREDAHHLEHSLAGRRRGVEALLVEIEVDAQGDFSALAQGGPSREVPVGHRQPKAGEVLQGQQQLSDPDKKMKELDDALAKKLKGICRGC
jgi:hypothetical protein